MTGYEARSFVSRALLLACAGLTACSSPEASDGAVVGVVLDYSGSATADGFLVERSAILAADLIGAQRQGQSGFRLSFKNARGRPEVANQCARELVEEGAVAVLGPSTDGLVEAVGQPLRDADVLLVSPTATTGFDAGQAYPWVRMSPGNSSGSSSATLYGENLAKSLLERGVHQVDVLVGDSLYDGDFASAFTRTFTSLGGAAGDVPLSGSSVPALAGAILSNETGAEGYVLALDLLVAAQLITEVAAVAPEPVPWFLTPRLKSDLLIVNTPPGALARAVGVSPRIAAVRDACDTSGPSQCFLRAYQERWNDNPPDEAYFMYDSSAVLLIALDRLMRSQAEPATSQQLMDEILGVATRGGVQIGWNDFAAAHDASGRVTYVGLTGPIILDPGGTRRSGNTALWHVEGEQIVNDYD